AVEQHREDLPPAEAIRLKREVTPIRSPGRALVVAETGGETTRVRAVRAHRPEVVRALSLRVDDRVALRRPARLGVKAGRGDLAEVGPVQLHHEEGRPSRHQTGFRLIEPFFGTAAGLAPS